MRLLLGHLLRSRAVHFLALGAALFAITPRRADPSRVVLSQQDLDALHATHASRLGAPSLSPAQIEELDERAIEDAVLYREALRYGLDRGDNVVRQHLVQKMLLLAEDMAGATRTPTDAELRSFYEGNRARWTRDDGIHFVHVFAGRREDVARLAPEARASTDAPPLLGDAFPSSRDVTATRAQVSATFGDGFAAVLFAQAAGEWGPPTESKLGWHLAKVIGREPGRAATFDEVRPALALEWAVDRRHRAIAAFLTRAFERYEVTIDGARRPRAQLATRLARRLDPSGED